MVRFWVRSPVTAAVGMPLSMEQTFGLLVAVFFTSFRRGLRREISETQKLNLAASVPVRDWQEAFPSTETSTKLRWITGDQRYSVGLRSAQARTQVLDFE